DKMAVQHPAATDSGWNTTTWMRREPRWVSPCLARGPELHRSRRDYGREKARGRGKVEQDLQHPARRDHVLPRRAAPSGVGTGGLAAGREGPEETQKARPPVGKPQCG